MNTDDTNRLIMRWTEVADPRGGTRLEARWIDPSAAAARPVAAHAA